MAKIPAKVQSRLIKETRRFQKVLAQAKDADINEADTVTIVTDMLSRIFGYDKYLDVTSELAVKNTFCDLAVKVDGKIEYLIEVKAIGLDLKENHLRQAINYGANEGIPWVVLTNGVEWQVYKVIFERPIDFEHLCTFNFEDINARTSEDADKLFLLCKTGMKKRAIEDYDERMQSVNRFVIGAILISKAATSLVRRELRGLSPGLKVTTDEIENILRSEVLKRDVVDGDAAKHAQNRLKKVAKKKAKRAKRKIEQEIQPSLEEEPCR